MPRSISQSYIEEYKLLVGELFKELKPTFYTRRSGRETLMSNDASDTISRTADNNFELLKEISKTSEKYQGFYKSVKEDFALGSAIGGISFGLKESNLRKIHNAFKQSFKDLPLPYKTTAHSIALALGYAGWKGYLGTEGIIPNYIRIDEKKNNNEKNKIDGEGQRENIIPTGNLEEEIEEGRAEPQEKNKENDYFETPKKSFWEKNKEVIKGSVLTAAILESKELIVNHFSNDFMKRPKQENSNINEEIRTDLFSSKKYRNYSGKECFSMLRNHDPNYYSPQHSFFHRINWYEKNKIVLKMSDVQCETLKGTSQLFKRNADKIPQEILKKPVGIEVGIANLIFVSHLNTRAINSLWINCEIFQGLKQTWNTQDYDVLLKRKLINVEHLVLFKYTGQILFKYFTKENIKTLYFKDIQPCHLNLSILKSFKNIERIGIDFEFNKNEDFEFDLNSISSLKKLREVHISTWENLKLKNELILFNSNSVRNLKFNISKESSANLKHVIQNNVLEELQLCQGGIALLNTSVIQFTNLKVVTIGSKGIHGFINLDLKFLQQNKSIEKLRVLYFSYLSNYSMIKNSKLKEIEIHIKYPNTEDEFNKTRDILQTIYTSKIERINLGFVLYRGVNYFDEKFLKQRVSNTINELLDSFDLLAKKSVLLLTFRFYHMAMDDNKFTLNYNLVVDKQIFKFEYADNHWHVDDYNMYEIIIDNFHKYFINRKPLQAFYYLGFKLNNKLRETKTLNFYIRKITEMNNEFLSTCILNSDFQLPTIHSISILESGAFPFKHIRFINTYLGEEVYDKVYKGNTRDGNNMFYFVEKISFSSLRFISFSKFVKQAKKLKVIEILKHYMPLNEQVKIPEYKRNIESHGIKCTINEKKLKVINAEKGLLETEVIE